MQVLSTNLIVFDLLLICLSSLSSYVLYSLVTLRGTNVATPSIVVNICEGEGEGDKNRKIFEKPDMHYIHDLPYVHYPWRAINPWMLSSCSGSPNRINGTSFQKCSLLCNFMIILCIHCTRLHYVVIKRCPVPLQQGFSLLEFISDNRLNKAVDYLKLLIFIRTNL